MYNKIYGTYGENLAKKFLKKAGYKILVMNYSKHNGEADIIAIEKKAARKKRKEEYNAMPQETKNEDVIVFVEVKTRSTDFIRPHEAVDKKKQNTYQNIARTFFMLNQKFQGMSYRFDIIEVTKDKVDNHIINAF